jgi:hypothetical protein
MNQSYNSMKESCEVFPPLPLPPCLSPPHLLLFLSPDHHSRDPIPGRGVAGSARCVRLQDDRLWLRGMHRNADRETLVSDPRAAFEEAVQGRVQRRLLLVCLCGARDRRRRLSCQRREQCPFVEALQTCHLARRSGRGPDQEAPPCRHYHWTCHWNLECDASDPQHSRDRRVALLSLSLSSVSIQDSFYNFRLPSFGC